MKDVFLSYRSSDFDKAASIKSALEKENISVWMAPADIPAGSSYGAEIPFAIESCQVFLLILSSAAQTSKWIPKEIDRAINEGKKIIPYMIEKCSINKEFGFFLSDIQIKEAYKNEDAVFAEILKEIRAVTEKIPTASPEKEDKDNTVIISRTEEKDSEKNKSLNDGIFHGVDEASDENDDDDKEAEESFEAVRKRTQSLSKKFFIMLLGLGILGVVVWAVLTFSNTVTIGGTKFNKTDKKVFLVGADIVETDIINLSYFDNLQEIEFVSCDVNTDNLSSIPFENIRTLIISNCDLSQKALDSLNLSKATKLFELDISHNLEINNIKNFEEVSDTLKTLNISGTKIKDIDFLKGNKTIEYLFLDGLGLSSLSALEECIYLKCISAKQNNIISIDGIKNCTILKDCDLSGNTYLDDITILGKSAQTLENLDISGNIIEDISALSGCEKLKRLKMQDNKISSLSALSGCKELEYLDASGNEITSVDGIAGTNEFLFVDLSDNRITEIPTAINFKDGGYIEFLLHNNELESICLDAVTIYENLYLHGNNISSYDFLEPVDLRYVSVDYIEDADFSPFEKNISAVWISDCPLDKQVSIESSLQQVYFEIPTEFPDFTIKYLMPYYR